MKKKNTAVEFIDVVKEYVIHHEKPTLVEKFITNKTERYRALNNINLIVNKGERVGIVGRNGAGKTTLLKVIVGVATPTSGTVRTNGKIVSLIDLEAGFHPDLTGEQNIYLNGLLLGMGKKEIREKIDSIIQLADIKQFIDVPFYTYSHGMKMRLSFSVAIHANPDILIFDEILSVGDSYFLAKVRSVLDTFFRQNKTIIIVSHQKEILKSNCKRFILLDQGKIIDDVTNADTNWLNNLS